MQPRGQGGRAAPLAPPELASLRLTARRYARSAGGICRLYVHDVVHRIGGDAKARKLLDVRLAQKMDVSPCIPVGTQL
jgi:hypothetical protein